MGILSGRKQDATRARRTEQSVALLAEHEKLYP
jgi:hypothetical protein